MLKVKNKLIYYSTMLGTFLGILLFNILTPYMSDDFVQIQMEQVKSSFLELLKYGYEHYMTMNGRCNTHIVIRFVLEQDVWVFNVLNSLVFVGLIQLLYYNVKKKNKYDVKLYLFITAIIWIGSVEFGQTVLWKTGAINYLWATTLMIGFLSFYKFIDEKWEVIHWKKTTLIFLGIFAIMAGWCNENTSGGILLYVGIKVLISICKNRKIYANQIVSIIGIIIGLTCMVLAPGYRVRLSVTEEAHTGMLAMLSRVLKTTNSIYEHFYWMLILLLFMGIVVIVHKGFSCEFGEIIILTIVSAAICYAIVVIPTPIDRVYFGAGIFLALACSQVFQLLSECDLWARIIQYSLVGGLIITFFFTYVEASAQLLRISLQYKEREESIYEQLEDGKELVTVTPYEEIYRTEYSYIHDSDITIDKDHWSNWLMSQYYGAKEIVREEE